MAVVVDTNIVSFLFKGDTRGDLYLPHLIGEVGVISFMTLAELHRWALERNWGQARKARMQRFLRRYVLHPYDRSLCLRWAEVSDQARRKGRPIGVADAWVAATALTLDIALVTHNPGDYAGVTGLTIITEAGP